MSKVMGVLSGGQDSATCLALAAKAADPGDEVHAITFNYGQRHFAELQAATKIAELFEVDSHEIVHIQGILKSVSPLTSDAPLETYPDAATMEKTIGDRVELTFVPLRNPFFLLIAANHALALGCDTLVTGICAMDNANYPDCTPTFRHDMEHTINEALGRNKATYDGPWFRIEAPLLYKTKEESVRIMMNLPNGREALALSHTCYAGEVPPCGKCHACVLRAEGFRFAGVADPLVERWNEAGGVLGRAINPPAEGWDANGAPAA